MGLVFLGFLIFGLFNGFSVKTAEAVNNYIDNTKFYKNDLGLYTLEFHVKTSFTWGNLFWCYNSNCQGLVGKADFDLNKDFFGTPQASLFYDNVPSCYTLPIWSPRSGYYINTWHCDLVAGNTYKINVNSFYVWNIAQTPANAKLLYQYNLVVGNLLTLISGRLYPAGDNNEQVAFSEFPSLTITYPQNNMEIAESFDIQGSYTLPAGSGYNLLMAGFFKAGNYDINWNNAVNVFTIPVSEPSGSFDNLRVSNYLPKDNYDIYFRVYGGGLAYEFPFYISNINIVSDLPYELPITGETPPDIPSFTTPSAQKIYEDYSDYDTPTPLFNIITGAIEPISQTIGDNLTFFSSRFKITNAKDAGEKAGNAVLIIRANAGVINSFFNDLPIAEILFLYLSALVVVIVFRIIRLLLKLIPFT